MAKGKKNKATKNKIVWNWAAFLLGPLWYAIHGLWSPALIMLAVLIMSGFVLVLPIAIYCGLRFDEDYQAAKSKSKK
ncbi:MAG: DUF2628 domain-containing protein [Candidatus Margulisbacteria bacterium]|nr:DUF2628 domain-containing protein [Candidatus Margulisiibacteriota bacterium]